MTGNTEIERKFLLASGAWRAGVTSSALIQQVYLASTPLCQIRLRRYGAEAFVTIKSPRKGLTRTEIETPVPAEFVDAVLAAGLHPVPPITKNRHLVPIDRYVFEIDEYRDANDGLVVAEIELPGVDVEFPRPSWLGAEVSHDPRYGNLFLAQHPYSTW